MNYKTTGGLLATLLLVGYIALIYWWVTAQWEECRSIGFSVLYCIKHVM
jgi:hypothetical protein